MNRWFVVKLKSGETLVGPVARIGAERAFESLGALAAVLEKREGLPAFLQVVCREGTSQGLHLVAVDEIAYVRESNGM